MGAPDHAQAVVTCTHSRWHFCHRSCLLVRFLLHPSSCKILAGLAVARLLAPSGTMPSQAYFHHGISSAASPTSLTQALQANHLGTASGAFPHHGGSVQITDNQ